MILNFTRERLRGALLAACAIAMSPLLMLPAAGTDNDPDATEEYVDAAEDALRDNDFLTASAQYLKAAELSSDIDIAKRATRIAFSYGIDGDAVQAARRWTELDEESDEALLYLALSELRNDKIRQSRNSFRKLLERAEGKPDERLMSLIPFLSEENIENADKLMRQLAKPYDESPEAHYSVAVLALYAGDSEEAQARALKAAELKPEWLKPHLLYARALLLAGDEEAAIDYTARLVGDTADPDPEARLELAIMYLSAGRDDDALSQVNQVLLEQPSRTDALRLLAIINFRLENLDAAWDDFEDLLASGSYTMDAFYYLARIADHREESERAIALYSKVVQGDNAAVSQRRVAGILAEQKEYDQAANHLERFATEHPAHAVDMMQAQAQLFASQERYDEALEKYEQVIEYRPDDENTVLGKAELLLRMGRLDDAIDVYRDAVDRWPDSAIALNALGYTLADRTTRYKDAEKLIKKALKIDPTNPAIIDSHGWVLYKLGRYEEARAELEKAFDRFEDPEVAAHIVEVLWKMGRQDDAMLQLVDAEERWPEDELLEQARALIESELGQ